MSILKPRQPILTEEILRALRDAVRRGIPDTVLPTDWLQRLLNDRDDWMESAFEQQTRRIESACEISQLTAGMLLDRSSKGD